jgi:hypothetical protein
VHESHVGTGAGLDVCVVVDTCVSSGGFGLGLASIVRVLPANGASQCSRVGWHCVHVAADQRRHRLHCIQCSSREFDRDVGRGRASAAVRRAWLRVVPEVKLGKAQRNHVHQLPKGGRESSHWTFWSVVVGGWQIGR